jgi:hypothetical protein
MHGGQNNSPDGHTHGVTLGRVILLHCERCEGWRLPPFRADSRGRPWIHGGERTLLEVAAAAAMTHRVELRGRFDEHEVARTERDAGVQLERPASPRAPGPGDAVIMPEGVSDPLVFAQVALSPARAVLLLLAAPGLFGWPFDRAAAPLDPTAVDPRSVGRPEQLEAARRLGFELWTNLAGIAAQASARGLPHHYIGVGRPAPYPEPPGKRVDVVTLVDNRWAELARAAVDQLDPHVTHVEVPTLPRDELLVQLGTGRVFIHPARIEGRSRLGEEARAMGTVPVVLASNHMAEGNNGSTGGLAVDAVEQIAPAVHALLGDPDRLERLSRAGYAHAREAAAWEPFVARVEHALGTPDEDVLAGARGRAGIGSALADSEAAARHALDQVRAELDRAGAELDRTRAELGEAALARDRAERRYETLRRRKVVRFGLRASALVWRVRRR